jgi:hypothetical protein
MNVEGVGGRPPCKECMVEALQYKEQDHSLSIDCYRRPTNSLWYPLGRYSTPEYSPSLPLDPLNAS